MLTSTAALLSLVMYCECAYVWSSFWAPLVDPRVLGYQVDVPFGPGEGRQARARYEQRYGWRGERLIEDLGNGRGPHRQGGAEGAGDVRLHYTYLGADNQIQ